MTDQLTAAHALLAQFVEQTQILSELVEEDRPFDLTLLAIEQLADEARALVNRPAVATSPPVPGTAFYQSHTTPAPVALSSDPEPARRYWVMDEQYSTGHGPDFAVLDSLRATPEDDLGDEGFSISIATGDRNEATEAQADMWFHSRGFFRLSTSDALPPDVMARALAAAYLVVRDAAYARFDEPARGR